MSDAPLLPFELEALAKDPNTLIWLDPDRVTATLVKQQRGLETLNAMLKNRVQGQMTPEAVQLVEETNREIQHQRDVVNGKYERLLAWVSELGAFDAPAWERAVPLPEEFRHEVDRKLQELHPERTWEASKRP